MKKTIIYGSIALFLLLYSCLPKDVYNTIDPITLMLFKQNDTLVFTSALRIDSFVIFPLIHQTSISDKQYHNENIEVHYKKININKSEDSTFNAWYQTMRTGSTIPSFYWRNVSGDFDSTDTVFHLGNRTINKIFVYNDISTRKHYPNDIKKVWYCNLYGIIEYERYTGELFILNSQCFDKYIK